MSTKHTWHKGPPPHKGWYLTITIVEGDHTPEGWRWWNGKTWSICPQPTYSPLEAACIAAAKTMFRNRDILWCDYWPAKARVPRIDPRK